ncbi:MAG: MBL fold metallo-hydrolase [Chthoniobacterales bacterium]|nr:MBL fold metallo-hydrolase [Chthoniobacterales bacterium]
MIHVLDTLQLGRPGIIAATALETDQGIALFDTGPESTFDNIAAELARIGARSEEMRHVFLSHIHFDHAGAAWRFAELGATVYVHPRGARHLIDPAKLVESATRIFGDDMQQLWGRISPVPKDRIQVLEDRDIVRVGGIEIRAIATPGHASHHHVYHWDDTVFGGDIAGVRLGSGPPIPPFVPPELHVESWHESLEKIEGLQPARLYLPHFGLVAGSVSTHLEAVDARVRDWAAWFRDRLCRGEDEAQLIPAFAAHEASELRAGGATADGVADYEAADPSYMAVTAAARYWSKYHPKEIGGHAAH